MIESVRNPKLYSSADERAIDEALHVWNLILDIGFRECSYRLNIKSPIPRTLMYKRNSETQAIKRKQSYKMIITTCLFII